MHLSEARLRYVNWLLVTRDLSPHTIRAYDSDLAALECYLGPTSVVGAIDQRRLLEFIESQRTSGLAPTSLRRRASGLRGFCGWLLSHGLLSVDPWIGTTVAVGRRRRLPRTLASDDLDRLFRSLRAQAAVNRIGDAHRPLRNPHAATTLLAVSLMLATGARIHEVVGIRCGDLDLPGRSMRILGKGRRERHVYLTNDWIAGLMSRYLATRLLLNVQGPTVLFNDRGSPMSPAAMRSRLAKAAEVAGLSERVTPHMLRHTAATQLIEAGVDIRFIQRLLGHASLTTTEIYTHVSDRALRRVVSDADVLGGLVIAR